MVAGSVEGWRARALHEAGHAVAAHHLGVAFRSVVLRHDEPSLGCVLIDRALPRLDGLELAYAPVEAVSARLRRRIEAHLMVSCAGPAAEAMHSGAAAGHCAVHEEDRVQALLDLATKSPDEREHFLGWLQARTRTLLECEVTWAEVTAVAEALLARRALTRRDVSEVAAEGVDRWERSRLRRPAVSEP